VPHALAFITVQDLGDSAREAFFMFWETLWALILGFALSGAVQAFVSKDQLGRVMGRRDAASVARIGLRDAVVQLLLRGVGDGEVALSEGRRLR
jgi:hypothetical protein